jgi:hypothetical protein
MPKYFNEEYYQAPHITNCAPLTGLTARTKAAERSVAFFTHSITAHALRYSGDLYATKDLIDKQRTGPLDPFKLACYAAYIYNRG